LTKNLCVIVLLFFYEERHMKAWLWVIKHAALDAWDAKRALAFRSAMIAAALAVAAAVGLASWGLWDMLGPGAKLVNDRKATLLAPVADCERELSGLPQQARINAGQMGFLNPPYRGSPIGFTCRKDRDGEWIERRGLSASLAIPGADVGPWKRLDDLPWRYLKPQFSLRAWAESLGLAPLTQASRGLAASTDARQADLWVWTFRAFFGLFQGLLIAAYFIYFNIASLFFLGAAGGVGCIVWKAAASSRFLSRRLPKAICAIAAGVASSWALAQVGIITMAICAIVAPDLEQNVSLKPETSGTKPLARFEPLADCDKRLAAARVTQAGERAFTCRKEGATTLLVSFANPSWSDDAARADAKKILGLQTSRLSSGSPLIREPSWSAFLELAGWNEPTARNRAWAASTPSFGASSAGVNDWDLRAFLGAIFLTTMALSIALAVPLAKDIPQQCALLARRFKEKGEALASSSEFIARAQRRELDKHTPKATGNTNSTPRKKRL
jgi:hypothetical protein